MQLTAVLLQTHFFDRSIARTFARLQRDCAPNYRPFVLIHLSAGAPRPVGLADVPHHLVRTPEIRNPAYTRKSSGGTDWRIWDGGHTDLPLLHFAQAYPQFERYWNIEYDVRIGGRWTQIFNAFEDNPADFLSTSLRTAGEHPGWPFWPTLQPPPSNRMEMPEEARICCFMPLYRVSAAAARTMDEAYRNGWGGHCEVTWPTIVRSAGLLVEDIGGNGLFVRPANRGKFYASTPTAWNLSPGTCVFKPPHTGLFLRRGMIYHPVKPLSVTWCKEYARGLCSRLVHLTGLTTTGPRRAA